MSGGMGMGWGEEVTGEFVGEKEVQAWGGQYKYREEGGN